MCQNPSAPEAVPDRWTPPRDRAALAAYVRAHLGLAVPDVALCPDHATPLDYLWHAWAQDGWLAGGARPANADAVGEKGVAPTHFTFWGVT
jgi:hypothetical protein